MYYNPAGLSLLGGTEPRALGHVRAANARLHAGRGGHRQHPTDPDIGSGTPQGAGVAANSGDASLTNFLVSPFLGIGTDFGVEGLGVALGFYVPMGGQSKWDKAPSQEGIPGAEDGTQRWWVIEGSSRSMYATLAAGYRIEPLRLSLASA